MYYTKKQALHLLELPSSSRLDKLVKKGYVRTEKRGSHTMYFKEDILKYRDYVTTGDVAKWLGVSSSTVKKYIKQGVFKDIAHLGSWDLVNRQEVVDFLMACQDTIDKQEKERKNDSNPTSEPDYYTTKQVAEMSGYQVSTIYIFARDKGGCLVPACTKKGRQLLFDKDFIDNWLKALKGR